MKIFFLVVALGLAETAPSTDYKVCQPHSRPWQVYLRGGRIPCSGALINELWIVTSLNCALSSHSTATLGDHDVTVEEGTEQHIEVADMIHHDPYRSASHSLALLRLAKPAHFNQYVQPIPLPSRCPKPGETCYVSGWGYTISNQYELRQYLKCITVPVVDDQTCSNTLPEFMFWAVNMVCAGQENTDNCLSDDGSVMVCDGQLQGVQWYNNGCSNPADPTVYTKLCNYNDWINDAMDSYASTHPTDTTLGMLTLIKNNTIITLLQAMLVTTLLVRFNA